MEQGQAQAPQFGETRISLPHFSSSSVTVTGFSVDSASVVFANSVWQGQQPLVDMNWVEFSALAEAWKDETRHLSQLRKVFASDHYTKIIALGRDKAVPLIIRQLQAEGDTPYHWFAALVALTNEDPASAAGGNVRDISRSWIDWGRARYGRQLEAE